LSSSPELTHYQEPVPNTRSQTRQAVKAGGGSRVAGGDRQQRFPDRATHRDAQAQLRAKPAAGGAQVCAEGTGS
jgi:hypothetical protein